VMPEKCAVARRPSLLSPNESEVTVLASRVSKGHKSLRPRTPRQSLPAPSEIPARDGVHGGGRPARDCWLVAEASTLYNSLDIRSPPLPLGVEAPVSERRRIL